MKIYKNIYTKINLLLVLILIITVSCEREISDEAVLATYSTTPDVYIDGFSGGLEYHPFSGSYYAAFTVDTENKYLGSSAMRFDVPNVGDPDGAYAGAIFRDENGGRNLTNYDALTFWAKTSQGGTTINELGFGQDFGENKYQVIMQNTQFTTNWRKYIIPIPDASKLTQESGMFWYAEGPENGAGYTFWIDELKYEKLGTIAQPRPAILNGVDEVTQGFIGGNVLLSGLTQTLNLGSGVDQTIVVAPAYFEFNSSDESVATVNEYGEVNIIGAGNAIITATLNEVEAQGSLTLNSLGDFDLAPVPTRSAANVASVFSDTYENVPMEFYNGYWEPYQTTLSSEIEIDGDKILNYTNFNFVGNKMATPLLDATEKSNLHLNMYIPGEVPANLDFLISVVDFGPDQVDGGTDDTRQQIFFNSSDFEANTWSTLEIPITLANRNNIGLIIYENVNGSSLSNFYLDNIYFYELPTSPTEAAPTPTVPSANVISIFSDAYTNVAGSDLNPNWGQSTVVTQETIGGNNALKYQGLNYQGLTLGSSQDVSAMTHLHIDYFTANSSALNLYLISPGPIETPKTLPVPTNSGWVSLEIPLSDFSPVDLADVFQLKFDGNGDVFIDNIYFHN